MVRLRKESPVARWASLALLSLWSLIALFPVYWLAITSIKPDNAISEGPHYLPFLDFEPTLKSWCFILFDAADNVVWPMLNSLLVAGLATLLTVTLAAAAIYGLTRMGHGINLRRLVLGAFAIFGLSLLLALDAAALRAAGGVVAAIALLALLILPPGPATIPWRSFVFGLLATRILPPMALILPVYVMAWHASLLDTHLLLILLYAAVNLPAALWLLMPLIGERASDQEEAALLDGASHATILFTIVLPMLAGGVMAVSVIIFLLCWNEYLFGASFGLDRAMTMPSFLVGQMSMKEAQVAGEIEEWAHFSAASMLMILPALALAGVAQRWLGRLAVRR